MSQNQLKLNRRDSFETDECSIGLSTEIFSNHNQKVPLGSKLGYSDGRINEIQQTVFKNLN